MANKNQEPTTTPVVETENANAETDCSTEVKKCEDVSKEVVNVDFEALLKQQAAMFEASQQKIVEEMQEKINTLAANNQALTEELLNLKTNTAEENALLGEKIAQINGQPAVAKHNPYDPKLLYSVYNEEAKATTIMGGDEVECIVGLHEEITKNLQIGATEFKKYPYTVKLLKK